MPSFSQAVIVGNLTRDPELRYTPGGAAVCEFTLAVNRRWTKDGEKKEEVSFLDCVAWQKAAETIAEYMKKGRPMLVSGDIRQERWTDKSEQKRSRVKIHVNQFQFLGDSGKREEAAAPAETGSDDVPF